MNSLLPSALIIGVDNFVAIKLAKELINKDIKVTGVGEFVSELGLENNFTWVADLTEVEGNFDYIFDFHGDLAVFKKDKISGEKISFIAIDNKGLIDRLKNGLLGVDLNWRVIESWGVYGEGMERDTFLAEILEMAVKNKNLEVPLPEQEIRLLNVADLVEAILRASFLSNTEKKSFLIMGKTISSEDLARILIDKAKMTKMKVFQKEMNIFEDKNKMAEESERNLRWRPEIDFKEGIEETLQYFFSKIDEENRNQSKKVKSKPVWEIKKIIEEPKMKIEVEETVEDFEENIKPETIVSNKNDNKDLIKVFNEEANEAVDISENELAEEAIEEEDDFWEIPKFEGIKKTISEQQNETPVQTNVNVEPVKSKKNTSFWLVLLLMSLLLFLMIPIDWGVKTYKAVRDIKNIPELIKTKKYAKASEMVKNNRNRLAEIDNQINDWGLNGIVWFRNYQNTLRVATNILEIEQESIDLVKSSNLVMGAIFEGDKIDWETTLTLIKKQMEVLDDNLGLLEARLTGDLNWLPDKWKMDAQRQVTNLADGKKKIKYGLEIIDVLPNFLGVGSGEKKYLVLFQNESELRATGGFIGSYGLLTFKDGELINLEVKDVYEADGQLSGHVEPPVEIKNHLGEANWYMRDANWKADFVQTATDIQWFYDKEMKTKVDGVIGIDLAVARSILEVTGEIFVPDFNEKITKDNLYEQAEFYAEKKFFPGSNQKASFLGGLGKQMFETIKGLNILKKAELMSKTVDLLENNELQLAINDEKINNKMGELGWNGEIYKGKCSAENCMMDYFYLVESNLGVNKANYFLYRNMEQAVDITNGSISRTVKITYENTAKNSNWPGGDYKNYVRIYLPKDINLSQVVVMDGVDTTIRKIYKDSELRIREVDGKKEIGFLMTVPVSKKRIMEIRYSSNLDLSGKKKFSYINYIQRQPGSGETGLVNLISYPAEWQPGQVQPAASLVGGKLLFNQKLDRDIRMGVELEK
jgi:nucleoside-diphosphate-sugar epimerase